MEVLLLATAVSIPVLGWFWVKELMNKDQEIVEWQRAYAELATELELVRLGVSK
jgi:hypothetical protein